jgi:hypothetical protein
LDKNFIRLAEKTEDINSLIARSDTDILLPEGLCHFAFRRPCPVECEAYSSGVSEKQKRKNKDSASSVTRMSEANGR